MVRQAGVHLVEQILCFDEQAPIPGLQGLQQDADAQPGLTGSGWPAEYDIAGATDKIETCKLLDGAALHARLALPREGLQRPALGQLRTVDSALQKPDLLRLVLLSEEPTQELGIAGPLLLCAFQLTIQDLPDAAQFQVLQQLVEVVVHWGPPRG